MTDDLLPIWTSIWATRRAWFDVIEEQVKFTLLLRGRSDYLIDRYSERKESAKELSRRVNQRAI